MGNNTQEAHRSGPQRFAAGSSIPGNGCRNTSRQQVFEAGGADVRAEKRKLHGYDAMDAPGGGATARRTGTAG